MQGGPRGALTHVSDEDRLRLHEAVRGDVEALTVLLRKHASAVAQSITGRIPSRWRSVLSEDDVMQQTFADACMDIAHFDPDGDGQFVGWLCKLAQCNLRDAIRMLGAVKRGGRTNHVEYTDNGVGAIQFIDLLAGTMTSPSGRASREEFKSLLKDALARLPATYNRVVQRYDLEGCEIGTLARELDRSIGAVYMIRARAHDKLKTLLGDTTNFFGDRA